MSFQPAIDRPGELVSAETQGWACVRLLLQPGQRLLAGLVPAEAQRSRFRKSPGEVCVATLVPSSPSAVAPRRFGPLDEATRRRHILAPWTALALGHGVEQDETAACAKPRPRWSERQGLGLVWCGCGEEQPLEVAAPLLIRGAQSAVDFPGLLDSRGGQPFGDACTIGFLGAFLAHLGPVIWGIRLLDMRQQCSALAPQMRAASEQSARGPPLGRRASGLGEQAAAP